MNKFYKKPGLTLIEIIVSLALFAILAVAFLGLFSGSLHMTVRSGDREKTMVETTSSMDNLLSDDTVSDSNITKTLNTTVTIIYPDGTHKDVTGTAVDISTTNSNGSQVVIKGFIQ